VNRGEAGVADRAIGGEQCSDVDAVLDQGGK
jgi:hypothetical protein